MAELERHRASREGQARRVGKRREPIDERRWEEQGGKGQAYASREVRREPSMPSDVEDAFRRRAARGENEVHSLNARLRLLSHAFVPLTASLGRVNPALVKPKPRLCPAYAGLYAILRTLKPPRKA
jgi:hypothetical protein